MKSNLVLMQQNEEKVSLGLKMIDAFFCFGQELKFNNSGANDSH